MKTTNLARIKTLMIVALCFTSACSLDDGPGVADSAGGEQTVALGLQFQDMPLQTRAITDEDMSATKTLDILAFKIDGTTETFDYAVRADEMLDNPNMQESLVRFYSAKLRVASYRQRFVLLVNCREQVDQLLSSPDVQGTEKYALISRLRFSVAPGERWNTTSSTNYTPLPMWGESTPEMITPETWRLSAPSRLVLMVALAGVGFASGAPAINKFVLKSAHVFNTNTGGQIVPAPENLTTQGSIYTNSAEALYVTAPTVPPELKPYSARQLNPVEYPATGTGALTGVGGMFLFEIDANQSPAQTFCVVVGGVYAGDTRTTYYRVDLYDGFDQYSRVAIRRQFSYGISIYDVTAPGHATPMEAFNSRIQGAPVRSSSRQAGTMTAELKVIEPRYTATRVGTISQNR